LSIVCNIVTDLDVYIKNTMLANLPSGEFTMLANQLKESIHQIKIHYLIIIGVIFISRSFAQSLDIPSNNFGISFGNSKNFAGLRFNYRDHQVNKITGINVTLWDSYENEHAVVNGISLGIMPNAGYLTGIQFGALGVAAEQDITGFSFGLLGAGSGGDITGIGIGGLGLGSGGSLNGVFLGGLGVGCGGDISGIVFGGLGAGTGENMTGIGVGLLGLGAGKNLTGIYFGGLGLGAGEKISGITIGGLGVGSSSISGLTLGGLGIGATDIKGVSIAIGTVRIEDEEREGNYSGFAASAFNYIKGEQTGVSIGIVNYAYKLNGFQFGLINYVRDNPVYLKILPLINFNL